MSDVVAIGAVFVVLSAILSPVGYAIGRRVGSR